jgi:putative transcriptional regulator
MSPSGTIVGPARMVGEREAFCGRTPGCARHLNTSESTVQKWEAGTKRPGGMALKLLAVAEKHGSEVLA